MMLNTKLLGDYIFKDIITQSINVAANTSVQTTIPTSKDGYAFLGIVGWATSDNGVGIIQMRIYSDSTIVVFRNFTSSAKNVTATIRPVYIKR